MGSADGKLYCLRFGDGAVVWNAEAYEPETPAQGRKIYSSPVVFDDLVYIGTTAPAVYAFDAVTGARVWSKPVST